MSVIAFFLDHKEGHILPSFQLAHSLKAHGHDIIYLSITDNEKMVTAQGFRFYTLFSDVYPAGFNQENKKQNDAYTYNDARAKTHISKIIHGALDNFMATEKPDLFIMSLFLRIEALILFYKYDIQPVMLTTYLRQKDSGFVAEWVNVIISLPGDMAMELVEFVTAKGISFSSLHELVQPVASFHELVLCPKEFFIDMPADHGRMHNIGPSIFQNNHTTDLPDWGIVENGKKIIYASLGSYAISYGDAGFNFFVSIANAMAHSDMENCHLILSVGMEFDIARLGNIPKNVSLMRWVSQIDVLKQASLVITHGGLNTTKECIYYGVPMIVFPMKYDQLDNANLIIHHGLGKRLKIEDVTEESLIANILQVLSDNIIKDNISRMQQIFREKEEAAYGVTIIHEILAGTGQSISSTH